LFEYHDEPFATSSKLDNKVPYNIIRKRFTETRQLVNRQLIDQENSRKGKEETGYIMDFTEDEITVRPELHAPEIDPYDEIKLDQIT
jgi:tRNA A37 methylthiotransferase MiaB